MASSARGKLSGAALSQFNIQHPRGPGGKFIKKGGAAAALNAPPPAPSPSSPRPLRRPGSAAQRLRPTPAAAATAPAAVPTPAQAAASFAAGQSPFAGLPTPPAPSTSPSSTGGPSQAAALETARDAIYGRHPHANRQAFQMSAYSMLRRDTFHELDPAERSTVLGDLSYIMATSQSATAVARARRLFDRFTPPGTPSGQVPGQMAMPPANAGPGQVRLTTDPAGVKGMLRLSANPGTSGDGWVRLANGQTGPWGKYGAAGLMLRHVDRNGQERYLMVQRGPGISDPGKWQFPGGALDSRETPAEGATREVVEELGFKPDDFRDAGVHGYHQAEVPGSGAWKYTSLAVTVPRQLKPDLSSSHAKRETADARWMTPDEIRALDATGSLLKPLAGGALERNVLTLFPSAAAATAARPARPARLRLGAGGSAAAAASGPSLPRHKPSTGRNLVKDRAAQRKLLDDISDARKTYRGKTADERLAAIGAMQGYDDTPTVVTKEQFEALLATGDYVEAWRGMQQAVGGRKSAAQINEDLRSGSAYYGTGVFGNGYYFATRRSVAELYSNGTKNSVLRVLIPKAAKIERYEAVLEKAQKALSSSGSYRPVDRSSMGGGTLHDEGRYAAAAGLDGFVISHDTRSGGFHSAFRIAFPGEPSYNIVNRSVLIVQEAEA